MAIDPRTLKKYKIELVDQHEHVDLAVVKVVDSPHDIELRRGSANDLQQQDSIKLYGFPNYAPGNQCAIRSGHVTDFQIVSAIRKILIDTSIIAGNSGGPVLDSQNRVIGVAAKGADSENNASTTNRHEVIPIDALKHLKL